MLRKDRPRQQLVYYQVRFTWSPTQLSDLRTKFQRPESEHTPSHRSQNQWWQNCTGSWTAWLAYISMLMSWVSLDSVACRLTLISGFPICKRYQEGTSFSCKIVWSWSTRDIESLGDSGANNTVDEDGDKIFLFGMFRMILKISSNT